MSNQLSFHNTNVSVINHNNQIWFTANELARILNYTDQSSVNRIYTRNQDEFTLSMTCSVKLTDKLGQLREVRIFSVRGAHLIAMLAKTEVAKSVRKWLLDLADNEVANMLTVQSIQSRTIEVSKVNLEALTNHMEWIYKYYKEYNLLEVSRMLQSDFGARMHDHVIGGYLLARSII